MYKTFNTHFESQVPYQFFAWNEIKIHRVQKLLLWGNERYKWFYSIVFFIWQFSLLGMTSHWDISPYIIIKL